MKREDFLDKAISIHGDKYSYDNTIFSGSHDKINVTCKVHGVFTIEQRRFFKGFGCQKCSKELLSLRERKSIKQFVEEARSVHGNKYDYSKSEYKGARIKILITCPAHGEFWQTPNSHLSGNGCKICGNKLRGDKERFTKEDFIKKSRSKWGDKYLYNKVVYVNNMTKVCITCKEHGDFWQTPGNHTFFEGCPICSKTNNSNNVCGVGIYDIALPVSSCKESYSHWKTMLNRCFSDDFAKKHPTYKEVTVCKEWLSFSNFKKWFDENYIDGYDLDKDLFSEKENKIYSPDTCCFIPHDINVLISSKHIGKNMLPRGVKKENEKYAVRVCVGNGKRIRVGGIKTLEDATSVYYSIKRDRIRHIAEEYLTKGMITQKVYDGLLSYDFKKFEQKRNENIF